MVEKEATCVICGRAFTYVTRGGGSPRLTCSDECKKRRTYQRNMRWRETAVCPPDKHGTIEGYVNYKCPCDACREANTVAQRERRKKTV